MYIGSQKLMQKYDQYLLEHGYSIIELVDKASDCIIKHLYGQAIAFLCGPGNNGADGLSAAIKMHEKGSKVFVFVFSKEKISKANQYYLDQCLLNHLDVTLISKENIDESIGIMKNCDEIVDAMFGFGLNSSPRGLYKEVVEQVNLLCHPCVRAIDIPTGLDCNTGQPYPSVIIATQTISLTCMKQGYLYPDSRYFTGDIVVEILDVEDVFEEVGLYRWVDEEMIASLLKERRFDGHKGNYGRVGLITGCDEYRGASLLSTKSCVYSGSGVVTTLTVPAVQDALSVFCPEATTLNRTIYGVNDRKYDALLVGSGMGLSANSEEIFNDVMKSLSCPTVIDGDGLTFLSKNLELLDYHVQDIVLTPHMGEFERLCAIDDDIMMQASAFAKKHHITLVLKGPHTIITNGDVNYRNSSGNPAMSVGGMGDVLAGMITSFLGQGYSSIESALLAVYIHGSIADKLATCAYTVLPSRVIEDIPSKMKELMKKK